MKSKKPQIKSMTMQEFIQQEVMGESKQFSAKKKRKLILAEIPDCPNCGPKDLDFKMGWVREMKKILLQHEEMLKRLKPNGIKTIEDLINFVKATS